MRLQVTPFSCADDYGRMVDYFLTAHEPFLRGIGYVQLYCEPCAENPARNWVLSKTGFRFLKRYRTTPGLINFEREVSRYVIDRSPPGDPGA